MNAGRRELLAGVASGFLALGTGMFGTAALATSPVGGKPRSLDDLARAKGFRFGSSVGGGDQARLTGALADSRYWRLLKSECSVVVPENALTWNVLHPRPGVYDFARGDAVLAKAAAAGLAVRGRHLLWNRPKHLGWVEAYDFGANPVIGASRLMVEHINKVVGHYPGIQSWDVVNETVDPETGALNGTPFTKYLDIEAIHLAFHATRHAAPHAQLVYNDDMRWEPGNEKHRSGVLRLLENLKAHDVPVGALGLQSHLKPRGTNVAAQVAAQSPAWRSFLRDVTGMGLELIITELDCSGHRLSGDAAAIDAAISDYTRAYLDLTLDFPQVKTVLAWNLEARYASPGGGTGGTSRPAALYDADFRPTPLRAIVAQAFTDAPAR